MNPEILMIMLVTSATLGGQLLIKQAVTTLATRTPALHGVEWLVAALLSPQVIVAIILQGAGFLLWVVVVSRVKLGVAFALSGAFFYILLALLSWWLFGERLGTAQWIGLALISAGVLTMSLVGRVA